MVLDLGASLPACLALVLNTPSKIIWVCGGGGRAPCSRSSVTKLGSITGTRAALMRLRQVASIDPKGPKYPNIMCLGQLFYES